MTTAHLFMRYSDIGIASGLIHESDGQNGRGSEAASACSAALAGRTQAVGSGQAGRRATANGVSLKRCARSPRDRRLTRHEQRWTPRLAGCRGARPATDRPDGRADRAWLRHSFVDPQASAVVHRTGIRGDIQRSTCVAPARADGCCLRGVVYSGCALCNTQAQLFSTS